MRKSEIQERRALSARAAVWQSRRADASAWPMKSVSRFLALAAAIGLAATAAIGLPAPASAVPGGPIGTLAQGRYRCELPGDALSAAGRPMPEADFTVVSASSYRSKGRLGSYLLTGDDVVMTSGPHRGQKYHRLSRGFLRRVGPGGQDTGLRCVLSGPMAQPPLPEAQTTSDTQATPEAPAG